MIKNNSLLIGEVHGMSILEMDEEEGINERRGWGVISPFYYEKVRDHTL